MEDDVRYRKAPCGTRSAYVRGCHCDDCREAQRRYDAERWQTRRQVTDHDVTCVECGVTYAAGKGNKHVRVCSGEAVTVRDVGDELWRAEAKCRGADPYGDVFFPEKGGGAEAARALCKSCPVRTECLEYALKFNERFGIWGGMTRKERTAFARTEGKRCRYCRGFAAANRMLCDDCTAEAKRSRQRKERASMFTNVPHGFADSAVLATEVDVWQAPVGEDRRRMEAALAASDVAAVEGFGS